MSRNRRATNSVSLFPFLAVLVCAMGALIFLLIVITQQIHRDAVARADQSTLKPATAESAMPQIEKRAVPEPVEARKPDWTLVAKPLPEPIDPNIELQENADRLAQQRALRRRQLDEQRTFVLIAKERLTESESAFQETKQHLLQVKQQQQNDSEARQSMETERTRLLDNLGQTERRIRQVRQRQAQSPSKYAFIPFDGTSGTTRRPIYIECTNQGLRILPEDILLTASELDGFTVGYNPLLAGVQSLVKYWSLRKNLGFGSPPEPEPYVLLLVRPSGSVAYYSARKMLSQLGQPSGYELLEEDWKLDLPDADPQAAAVCREAIKQTLANRKKIVNSRFFNRNMNNRGFRFSRGGGGMQREERDARPPRRITSNRATKNQFAPVGNRTAPSPGKSASEPEGFENPFPVFGQPKGHRASIRRLGNRPQSRRWGLSTQQAGIGLERAVAIRIWFDRVIVGSEQAIRVGRGETNEQLLEQVVDALDREARSWGKPPKNFYWVPSLNFQVSPGGNQFYERLHGPLKKFGLPSTVEHRLEIRNSTQ
jgi:hypothetical protein